MYVDVHTHLTHEKFSTDWQAVIARAEQAGLESIVVNGLEPNSNRQILKMAAEYRIVQAALGIYPLDAVNHLISDDFSIRVGKFNVQDEIDFIRQQAEAGQLIAIGECGLDGHWLGEDTWPEQEKVFTALIEIAMANELPLIIHTRKLEARSIEILAHYGTKKVNFHCFGGRTKLAKEAAEKHHWYFSIPANARVNEAFTKMLKILPAERILTETDAPYLGPVRGERNEPANVVPTVAYFAELRGWSEEQAKQQIWQNYLDLFKVAKLAGKGIKPPAKGS